MLNLIPLPYRLLALAILIVATFAAGWVKGDQHGTEKLTVFIAKQAAEVTRIAQARTIITEKISDEHAKQDAAIAAKYDNAVRLLNASASAKPVPVAANVCNDQAGNDRLSAAIERYLERDGQITAGERTTIEERVGKPAELQTKSLVDTEQWLLEQGKVR